MDKNGIFRMFASSGCSHQFSWPRRSPSGEYYQVCVLCGVEYNYDWSAMRRLGRRASEPAIKTTSAQKRAVRWSPRARRMRLSGPVRYRELDAELWSDGELKNISKSGVLFAGSSSIPEGVRIELELEMPAEICGSVGRQVRCIAQIVRAGAGETAKLCAARIYDYAFVDPLLVVKKEVAPRRLICAPRYKKRHTR